MFASAATVDLTGPCEFEMTGPNRGRLTSGSLEAFVPENAQGFTVDLPGGWRVVDLGTRFSLSTRQGGETLVAVKDGSVRLEDPSGAFENLTLGQIARIGHGSPRRVVVVSAAAEPEADAKTLDLTPSMRWPRVLEEGAWIEIPTDRLSALDPDRAWRVRITAEVESLTADRGGDQWFAMGFGVDRRALKEVTDVVHQADLGLVVRTHALTNHLQYHSLFADRRTAPRQTLDRPIDRLDRFTVQLDVHLPAAGPAANRFAVAAARIDADHDGTFETVGIQPFTWRDQRTVLCLASRSGARHRVHDLTITAVRTDDDSPRTVLEQTHPSFSNQGETP